MIMFGARGCNKKLISQLIKDTRLVTFKTINVPLRNVQFFYPPDVPLLVPP